MISVRRTAVVIMAACLFAFLAAGSAFAQDVIGCVNPQKIMFQHPKFESVQKQIKSITDKKQSEAKSAIDKEKDDKKKASIYQEKRQELAKEESKLMAPLFTDINLAIRTVANAKKITVVVDKDAVFYGGTDITDAVVEKKKKK